MIDFFKNPNYNQKKREPSQSYDVITFFVFENYSLHNYGLKNESFRAILKKKALEALWQALI